MPLSAQLIMVKLSQNQSIVFIFVLFQSLELALVKTQAVVQSIVVVVLVVVVFSFFFFFFRKQLYNFISVFVASIFADFCCCCRGSLFCGCFRCGFQCPSKQFCFNRSKYIRYSFAINMCFNKEAHFWIIFFL